MNKPAGGKVLYPELSYAITAIAYEVHNQLGPGFSEDIYQNAIVCESEAHHIPHEQQKSIQVTYKGRVLGNYRLDLVIGGSVILEPKAVPALSDLHEQQLLSYLKAANLRLGILINFGGRRVAYDRIVNQRSKREWHESTNRANEEQKKDT